MRHALRLAACVFAAAASAVLGWWFFRGNPIDSVPGMALLFAWAGAWVVLLLAVD